MIIDSHQHFWKYNPARETWIDDAMQVIRKDFLPKDLHSILKQNKIDGCIAVQASESEEETNFLLDLSDKNDFIKGVVGWVDLCADNVEERLAHFSKHPKFKGVRHIIQAENNNFLLRDDFQNGISKLQNYNLVYDILIQKEQLENTIKLVEKFPNQSFVLDHIAKPNIKEGKLQPWKKEIQLLSCFENVSCKISGMLTEANWDNFQYEDFTPYLGTVINVFGTGRILFGSDWPVCLLAGNYNEQLAIINKYLSSISFEDRHKIMGQNAQIIYNL